MFASSGESGPPCGVPTLWGAHLARFYVLTDPHSGAQVVPDEKQQSLIGNASPKQVHQHVMVDGVKELSEIDVHCDASAVLHNRLHLPDCLVCIAAWSETETRIRERRVEYRREHLGYCLLDDPVHDRRYPQHAFAATVLGYFYPAHGLRLVSPFSDLLSNR